MALPRSPREMLSLAHAAQRAGTSETALRHAIAVGELRCGVSAQGDELTFVLSPDDVDAWVARQRFATSPATPHAAEDTAGEPSTVVPEVAGTLAEIAADLEMLRLTGMRLLHQVDQTGSALEAVRATVDQHAADAGAGDALVDHVWAGLTRHADMQTRARLLLTLTWQRLERSSARLHALQDTLNGMAEQRHEDGPLL
ncbi:MAG: hypothetical protein NVSMB65_13130 [Chloroflexota bacterium]